MLGILQSILRPRVPVPSERACRTANEPAHLFGLGDDAIRANIATLPVFGAFVPAGWRRGEMVQVTPEDVSALGHLARTKQGAGFAIVSEGGYMSVAVYYRTNGGAHGKA